MRIGTDQDPGRCGPGNCGSQKLQALFICCQACYAWRFVSLTGTIIDGSNHCLNRRLLLGGALMVNSALLFPCRTLRPVMLLSFTCTVIWLVPGTVPPGKLIFGFASPNLAYR